MAQAQLANRLAKLHSARATPLEQELVDALAMRYAMPLPEERDELNQAYADAMRKVHAQYADDPLVVTLFAEALMNLQPWLHWSPEGEPDPRRTKSSLC